MIDVPVSDLISKDLRRWFKEKWVDVSRKDKDGKHPPCGRDEAKTDSKGYPKCRPSKKVSEDTPTTTRGISSKEKKAMTRRKRSKPQGVGGKPTMVKSERKIMYDIRDLPTGPSMTPAWSGYTAPDEQGNTRQMVALTPYGLKFHGDSAMFRTDEQGMLAMPDKDFGEETASRFTGFLAPVMAHEIGHALDSQQGRGSKFQTELPAHVLEQATREAIHGRQGYEPQAIIPKARQLARDRFYDQGTNDFILPPDDPNYEYDITDDLIVASINPFEAVWDSISKGRFHGYTQSNISNRPYRQAEHRVWDISRKVKRERTKKRYARNKGRGIIRPAMRRQLGAGGKRASTKR
jgi:hypothetical protein